MGGWATNYLTYAAARTLADKNNTDLVFDATEYRDQWTANATRPLVLHKFPVRAEFRNFGPAHTKQTLMKRVTRRLREDLFSTHAFRTPTEVGFFDEFRTFGARTVLRGHFIDPRFFAGNEARIRTDLSLLDTDFRPRTRLSPRLDEIGNCVSVSVHVRRGDLLEPAHRWQLLPLIEQYYERAFEQIAAQFTDTKFFVFSDDPEWCMQSFHALPYRFVYVSDGRSDDPVEDFYLMSRCTHHVIANSTFSWWAAWLSPAQKKQVFAPAKWETRGIIDMNSFVPTQWLRIAW